MKFSKGLNRFITTNAVTAIEICFSATLRKGIKLASRPAWNAANIPQN